MTALRIEGVAPSVAHRIYTLEEIMKPFGELHASNETESRAFWKAIRDVTAVRERRPRVVAHLGRAERAGTRSHGDRWRCRILL